MLEVRDLTTVFETAAGPLRAVDEVGLDLAEGETLGLVGESGCGKSAPALSIVGMIRPPGRVAGGSVRFAGRELLGLRRARTPCDSRRRGSPRLPGTDDGAQPGLHVGAQVAETLVVHGRAPRDRAGRDVRRLACSTPSACPIRSAVRATIPHQLSGGMRQRVLIAIALACSPSLLIADEPTTALDVTIQAQILDLLREMRDRCGLSLLLVTHDLGVVAGMADRVAVMYAGRVVESAPVGDDLLDRPGTRTRAACWPRSPASARAGDCTAIDGAVPDLAALPPGAPSRLAVRSGTTALRAPPPHTGGRRLWPPGETVRCFAVPIRGRPR